MLNRVISKLDELFDHLFHNLHDHVVSGFPWSPITGLRAVRLGANRGLAQGVADEELLADSTALASARNTVLPQEYCFTASEADMKSITETVRVAKTICQQQARVMRNRVAHSPCSRLADCRRRFDGRVFQIASSVATR